MRSERHLTAVHGWSSRAEEGFQQAGLIETVGVARLWGKGSQRSQGEETPRRRDDDDDDDDENLASTDKSMAGIDIWFACAIAETACEYSGA